mgnify:CR=1 FL=1
MKLFEIKKLVGAPDNTKRDSIRRDLHFYVNKIKSWLVRLFVRIIGDNPILEKINSYVITNRSFLPKELMILKGDTIVQVGTHKQETVSRIAKAIGKNGRAVIIEASKENFDYLNDYVSDCGWTNISLVNKAASNKREALTFLVSKILSDHRLEDDNILHDNDLRDGGYERTEVVQADTVDNILDELDINSIDYIEITVNGAELKVLEGMKKTMKNTKRIYTKSFAIDQLKQKVIANDILEILKTNGFIFFIGKPSKSVLNESWGERSGDIYAFRGNQNE